MRLIVGFVLGLAAMAVANPSSLQVMDINPGPGVTWELGDPTPFLWIHASGNRWAIKYEDDRVRRLPMHHVRKSKRTYIGWGG